MGRRWLEQEDLAPDRPPVACGHPGLPTNNLTPDASSALILAINTPVVATCDSPVVSDPVSVMLIYLEARTMVLPSESFMITDVPQGCFTVGDLNYMPFTSRASYAFSTLTTSHDVFKNLPTRFAWPWGVNKATPVSAPGMDSSIQRLVGVNCWSVKIRKPSF